MGVKEKLTEIAGNGNVEDGNIEKYCTDESPFKGKAPNYLVKVNDADTIREIIRFANKKKIPVVPSSSKIHYTGASLPAQGGILLDMSEMDQIRLVDERNRKIIFEPGVNWKRIDEELEKKNMRMFNPLFPNAGTSALTDLLERTPAIIPKFEYADPILTLEAIMPAGDLMRTGSSSITMSYKGDNPAVDMVCPYGPGMDFFRLFHGAQGTLGIVTWVAAKLEHRSPLKKLFLYGSQSLEESINTVHRIQRLMIGQECFILDSENASLILSQGDISKYEELKKKMPAYITVMMLRGAKRRPEEKIAYEEDALKETVGNSISELSAVSEEDKKWLCENLEKCWPEEKTYWKNMLRGNVAQILYKTTMKKIPELCKVYKAVADSANIENSVSGLYIQPVENGRAYHCEHHIYYDAGSVKNEEIRESYRKIVAALSAKGAFFSRPYGDTAEITFDRSGGYKEAVRKVKNIFDPAGIMNPGRLSF